MVTLLDSNGNELATCVEQSVSESNSLVMGRVIRGKGNLVKYYFAQGLRSVHVQSEGFLLRGMLETSWLGAERQWVVRLTPIAVRDDALKVERETS
jgi:hypothetical protein